MRRCALGWWMAIATAGLTALAVPARAEPVTQPTPETQPRPPKPTPFDRGRFSLGFAAGTQSSFVNPDERHIYVGGGFGYYVLPGLEAGLSGIVLFGADPGVAMLSPSVRMVFYQVPGSIKPYLGGFHTHWLIGGGISDVDTVGGRVGLVTTSGSLVIGLGAAYEVVVSECDGDCSAVYPELTFSVAF